MQLSKVNLATALLAFSSLPSSMATRVPIAARQAAEQPQYLGLGRRDCQITVDETHPALDVASCTALIAAGRSAFTPAELNGVRTFHGDFGSLPYIYTPGAAPPACLIRVTSERFENRTKDMSIGDVLYGAEELLKACGTQNGGSAGLGGDAPPPGSGLIFVTYWNVEVKGFYQGDIEGDGVHPSAITPEGKAALPPVNP